MFPAPAGINRTLTSHREILRRVPRASGDKPGTGLAIAAGAMCSPRQRG
ncbi:hypothetical protein A676_02687 [Salmonella enterica subsp. enterica serovar Enteritidis str. 2010K-0262]|nr:hypothetical protein A676_02687 [Salmonella enterica subsp. enterica serovar Enteritidis str. 2010K-0262]EPJ01388.1 hypothetical protein A679_02231 [Salmonella enterica subsp. enterica serovar Enteritidis str. 2010K-0284]EPJ03477.1 hypothetical protein A678_01934 [Salmonella enterica subsp. enterica serovar Enteritidis str. 2010K-0271]